MLDSYTENHHILPRCMNGSDAPQNLVELTAEEHYVAHQLLVKMHPGVAGLIHAVVFMSRRCTGNKSYGWARKKLGSLWSGRTHSDESKKKMSTKAMGRRASIETRSKMSASHIGKTLGNKSRFGKPHSEETKEKIGAAHRGKVVSQETREKLSFYRRGKPTTLGRTFGPMSEEHKAKIAASNKGKTHSLESRKKMSLAQRGKKRSAEHLEKMSAMGRSRVIHRNALGQIVGHSGVSSWAS